MGTYQNCFDLIKTVRHALNEFDVNGNDTYTKGMDTTGRYRNFYLVQKVNSAQKFIYNYLFKRIPEEFLESVDLVGVDGVYTRPANYGKLVYFKNSDGRQIFPTTVNRLSLTASTGSDRIYYGKGNTWVLDKSGTTKTYTLFYYRKSRDLDFGLSTAGGAKSLTLATSAKKIVDYYNGMLIENVTNDWVDTISGYTTARVATIGTETGAADKYYGIVSDLPEMFHDLIAPKAVLLVKSESVIAEEKPSKADRDEYTELLRETLRAYAGSALDKNPNALIEDFSPQRTGGMRIVSNG